MTMRLERVALIAAILSCGPGADPTLSITASPRTIDNMGTPTKLNVTALGADGKPGAGMVKVTSSAGSLSGSQTVALDMGTATVDLSCDVNMDPACVSTVRAVAEWTTNGQTVGADTRVSLGGAGGGTGGGSGTGQPLPDVATCSALATLQGLSVTGKVQPLNTVDFDVFGGAGCTLVIAGFACTWDPTNSLTGMPTNILGVNLAAEFQSMPPVTGQTYSGGNNSNETVMFMNFAVQYMSDAGMRLQAVCPANDGLGKIRFDDQRVIGNGDLGAYTYHCANPLIDVAGCFSRPNPP
jgi:hypothetical protein